MGDELRAKRQQAFDRTHPRVLPSALAPPIAQRLQAVISEQGRISEAIQRADLPFEEVAGEVDVFVRAAEKTASRAQLLYEYLADHDLRRGQRRPGAPGGRRRPPQAAP